MQLLFRLNKFYQVVFIVHKIGAKPSMKGSRPEMVNFAVSFIFQPFGFLIKVIRN